MIKYSKKDEQMEKTIENIGMATGLTPEEEEN
jgi:hypothetical protein